MALTDKKQRNYILNVQTTDSATQLANQVANAKAQFETIISPSPNTIPNPYTIEFDIIRNVSGSSTATFRIYNLSQKRRSSILRDSILIPGLQYIEFDAGYGFGTNFPIAFAGQVSYCTSSREGTDIITTIECLGWGNERFQFSGQLNGNNNVLMHTIVQDMINQAAEISGNTGKTNTMQQPPILQLGAIGQFPGTPTTGANFNMASMDALNLLTNTTPPTGAYIENNKIYVLTRDQYIKNPAFDLIESSTGLLDVPIRRQQEINLRMIFEPRLILSQFCNLSSLVNDYLFGIYKVCSIKHHGIISPAVCGDAITEVQFFTLTNPVLVPT